MDRSSASSAVAFALAGGEPGDLGAVLHLDPPPRRRGRRLLAAVEPLEPGRRAAEVAAVALAALRDEFMAAGAAGLPAPLALGRALAAANAAVRDENRLHPGGDRCRRVLVGATAVALEGAEATVAQVPPTQALLVQDGRLYGFPALASWCPGYHPGADGAPEPDPLGLADRVVPALYRTEVAPGDLLALCSPGIARGLVVDLDIAPEDGLAEGMDAPPALADAERALEWLAEAAVARALTDAHGACVRLGREAALPLRLPVPALGRGAGARPLVPTGVPRVAAGRRTRGAAAAVPRR